MVIDFRIMKKLLQANGYSSVCIKGLHFMYSDVVNTVLINKDFNRMVAQRLVKQYHWRRKCRNVIFIMAGLYQMVYIGLSGLFDN